jgi:hypothetical protein
VLVPALVVALHGAAFGAPRLAVYPLKSVGASAEALQQLEAALRIELRRVSGLELAEGPVPAKLEGCRDAGCFAAYGKSVGAQEVLVGEVREMPDSYSVTMRLLDVSSGKEVARTAGSYNRDVEEMVWAMRSQVARLKAPQRYAGQLAVEAPAGSAATVNGSAVKLGERLVLKAGLHEVRVERAGRSVQSWVEVRFEHVSTARLSGEPATLAVTYERWNAPDEVEFARIAAPRNPPALEEPLVPLGAPPPGGAAEEGLPRWPAIVAIGVGVALAAGGAYELVHAGDLRSELAAMRGADGVPADQAAAAREKSSELVRAKSVGVALVAAGGVVAVGGAAFLILAPSPGGAQVAVAGRF